MFHPVRRTRLYSTIAIATLMVAGVSACSDDSSSTSTSPDATGAINLSAVSLRIGAIATTASTRQALRDASGAFVDAPYGLDFVEFDGSNAAMEALNAGAIDAVLDLQAPTIALVQGNTKTPWTAETAPIAVVAMYVAQDAPGIGLGVHSDSDINSVADLVGKKVTYSKGSQSHYFWAVLAAEAGLEPGDVEIVELPVAEGRAAFLGGAVDAFMGGGSSIGPLISDGSLRVLDYSSRLAPTYRAVVVRRAVLDDPAKSAAIGDLLLRYDRSEAWEGDHREEAIQIFKEVGQLDDKSAEDAAVDGQLHRSPLLAVGGVALQDQADVFFADGVTINKVDVSIVLDTRFEP